MDENKKEDLLFGGALRLGYEILKKNVKNPKIDDGCFSQKKKLL